MTPAEIRTNLIILAVILGASIALFAARAIFQSTPVAETPVPAVPVSPPPLAGSESVLVAPALGPGESTANGNDIVRSDDPGQPLSQPPVTAPAKSLPTSSSVTPRVTTAPVVKLAPAAFPETSSPSVSASGSKTVAERPAKTAPSVKKAPPVRPIPSPVAIIPAAPPEKPVPKKHKGTIIFVFDDAGHNLKQLAPFLALPFPCTIAVLPGLQYSREAAQRSRAAGKEVILHQPMQAINLSTDPGPGAIKKGMSADQIRAIVRKNLAEVGPVSGLNNHEGSLIIADRSSMSAVFDVVREKGIYFLDSRTNAKTVAPALARERNMTIWERAVFLDNSQDRSDIIDMVYSGMKIAENKGAAIMIGHIWSNDLANILTSMYPELVSQGFSLSTIAQIALDGDMDE